MTCNWCNDTATADRLSCICTSDREWAWWLTMRELAAVAGLALWVVQARGATVPSPSRFGRKVAAMTLGWEAPDAPSE